MAALMCALALAPTALAAHAPTLSPTDAVIDGPGAPIVSLNGMSIARDGSGGLVYLKDVGGVAHVFVSVLANGAFQPPVQIDPGLAGASSAPVIAAGNQGTLLVGFINGGGLYVADRMNGGGFGAPSLLYGAAANPSISMSNFGKAYIAFTATDGAGGGDVRTAYYYAGQWALESEPLDDNPADAAGVGSGRPEVTTAGDGTAIVAWGENGHIFTRRVVKTTPSVVDEQADVPSLDGWTEVSASDPMVAAGGDSSYVAVAFQETMSNGSTQQSRVLYNRLQAGQFDGVQEPDGITMGGPEGADQPQTSVTEYGDGWVVSEHDQTHELFATSLGSNASFDTPERIDSLANGAQPYGISSDAGLTSTFIAWQQNPGAAGPAEIRLRFAPDGSDLGGEQVISSPPYGATDAALGLVAAGDVSGDAAVAWVQGSGSSTRIVVAQLYQPPGGFVPSNAFRYARTAHPVLVWTPSAELWGPPTYEVKINGTVAGQTTATQFASPAPLTNGRHSYQVVAVNAAGVATAAPAATIFVDTVPPRVSFSVTGVRAIRHTLRVTVTDSDPAPRGLPRSDASGVALVQIKWGDGTPQMRIRRRTVSHTYKRKRTYTITVTVTDRAGNRKVSTKRIRIATRPPAAARSAPHRPRKKPRRRTTRRRASRSARG